MLEAAGEREFEVPDQGYLVRGCDQGQRHLAIHCIGGLSGRYLHVWTHRHDVIVAIAQEGKGLSGAGGIHADVGGLLVVVALPPHLGTTGSLDAVTAKKAPKFTASLSVPTDQLRHAQTFRLHGQRPGD